MHYISFIFIFWHKEYKVSSADTFNMFLLFFVHNQTKEKKVDHVVIFVSMNTTNFQHFHALILMIALMTALNVAA